MKGDQPFIIFWTFSKPSSSREGAFISNTSAFISPARPLSSTMLKTPIQQQISLKNQILIKGFQLDHVITAFLPCFWVRDWRSYDGFLQACRNQDLLLNRRILNMDRILQIRWWFRESLLVNLVWSPLKWFGSEFWEQRKKKSVRSVLGFRPLYN